jgi:hypothetical protein
MLKAFSLSAAIVCILTSGASADIGCKLSRKAGRVQNYSFQDSVLSPENYYEVLNCAPASDRFLCVVVPDNLFMSVIVTPSNVLEAKILNTWPGSEVRVESSAQLIVGQPVKFAVGDFKTGSKIECEGVYEGKSKR